MCAKGSGTDTLDSVLPARLGPRQSRAGCKGYEILLATQRKTNSCLLFRGRFNPRSRMGSDVLVLFSLQDRTGFNPRSRMGSDEI